MGLVLILLMTLALAAPAAVAMHGHDQFQSATLQAAEPHPEPAGPCSGGDDMAHSCCVAGGCAASALFDAPLPFDGLLLADTGARRSRSAPPLLVQPPFHPPK